MLRSKARYCGESPLFCAPSASDIPAYHMLNPVLVRICGTQPFVFVSPGDHRGDAIPDEVVAFSVACRGRRRIPHVRVAREWVQQRRPQVKIGSSKRNETLTIERCCFRFFMYCCSGTYRKWTPQSLCCEIRARPTFRTEAKGCTAVARCSK